MASAALLAFAIFLASPVHYVADSHYSLLMSESLYRHGTGALKPIAISFRSPDGERRGRGIGRRRRG